MISCFLDEVSRSLLGPIQEELAIMVFAFAAAGSGDDCELACDGVVFEFRSSEDPGSRTQP